MAYAPDYQHLFTSAKLHQEQCSSTAEAPRPPRNLEMYFLSDLCVSAVELGLPILRQCLMK
jgi:hypothetical protein